MFTCSGLRWLLFVVSYYGINMEIKTIWTQDIDKLQKMFLLCATGRISNSSQQWKLHFWRLHPWHIMQNVHGASCCRGSLTANEDPGPLWEAEPAQALWVLMAAKYVSTPSKVGTCSLSPFCLIWVDYTHKSFPFSFYESSKLFQEIVYVDLRGIR